MNTSLKNREVEEPAQNPGPLPERRGRRKRGALKSVTKTTTTDKLDGKQKASQSFIEPPDREPLLLSDQLATISDLPGQLESSSQLAGTEKAADDASHDAVQVDLEGSETPAGAHRSRRQRKSTISEALLKMEPLSVSAKRVKYPIASTKSQARKKKPDGTAKSTRSNGRTQANLTPSKKSSKKGSVRAAKDAKVHEVHSFQDEQDGSVVEGPAAEAPRPTLQEYYCQITESKSQQKSVNMESPKDEPDLSALSDNDVRLDMQTKPAPEPEENESRNVKSAQVTKNDSITAPSVSNPRPPPLQQFETSERGNAVNSSRWSKGGASAFKGENAGELKLEVSRLQSKIALLNQ